MNEQQASHGTVVDIAFTQAARTVLPLLFADANGETGRLMNQLLNEKLEEDKAYHLLIALMGSKLLPIADVATVINRQKSKEKIVELGRAYINSDPKDDDAISFMEIVKEKAPELIAEMISAKKDWSIKTVREQLMKHLFTKDLWLRLAEMETEIAERAKK